MARYRYLIAFAILALIAGGLLVSAMLATTPTIINEHSIGPCPTGPTNRRDVICYPAEVVP
jgi:hypothetical protein